MASCARRGAHMQILDGADLIGTQLEHAKRRQPTQPVDFGDGIARQVQLAQGHQPRIIQSLNATNPVERDVEDLETAQSMQSLDLLELILVQLELP